MKNREEWVQKMTCEYRKGRILSSDRTIEEYNRDIWNVRGLECV